MFIRQYIKSFHYEFYLIYFCVLIKGGQNYRSYELPMILKAQELNNSSVLRCNVPTESIRILTGTPVATL
jgi:hypothetical protein